jgi:penicillin-binding protein 1C
MLSRLGPETLLRLLRNAGFTDLSRTADYYGLGLTLGDAEVTLEQLVKAYAALARGGVTVAGHRLVSERTAFWLTDILSDSDARAYAFGSGGSLDFPFPVAVKTGTSQAYRDNWTIGYTRDVTVGVWVGNFDRTPLRGSSGVTGVAPIFNAVMLAAAEGSPEALQPPPADVESIEICTLSGARPSTYCPSVRREWLPRGAGASFCSWHHDGRIDYPAEFRAWAGAATPRTARAERKDERFRIVNPADGATYLIDPTLRTEFQTLRLRAASTANVRWKIDGRNVGDEWPLTRGRHVVTAEGPGGRDEVRIFVK